MQKRPLELRDILAWATCYQENTGKWPTPSSGEIPGSHGETWSGVENALRRGARGLAGRSTLAQLLAKHLGARNRKDLPPMSEQRILALADEHYRRTGSWPTKDSGTIPDSGGENWLSIDSALRHCLRGICSRSSLPKLLAQHRGVRNRKGLPPLTEEQILVWADTHRQRTGDWPNAKTGSIPEAPGETWLAADMALRHGQRGLPGGSSLALLLAEGREIRNNWTRPSLSYTKILEWADAFHARTGRWPYIDAGLIPEAPGETWNAVRQALRSGGRDLPGGFSLAELLAIERGVLYPRGLAKLERRRIVRWASAYYRQTSRWPTTKSGPIPESPGDTWSTIDEALRIGRRGLQGGSSLARLLHDCGKKRNHMGLPALSYKKILAWADSHFRRTGAWPKKNSGIVTDAPDERWDSINDALSRGYRGLPGGSSLIRLLARKRGVRDHSVDQIASRQVRGADDQGRDSFGNRHDPPMTE
jgi:hypothetical protein